MIRRRAALAAAITLAVLAGGFSLSGPSASATPPTYVEHAPAKVTVQRTLQHGSRGEDVKALQAALTKAGWPTWVDGDYGPHTRRMVKLYQQSNGLYVDGIAGPQTLTSLGLWKGASPTPPPAPQPAAPTSTVATAPPPVPSSMQCSEWADEAITAGWPQEELLWLGKIMKRESGCKQRAHNGRWPDDSYGLLQINTRGANWGELKWRCGLTRKDQLFDPVTNLSCGYKLYLAYGKRPWRVG